jgi:hypothetical protein
MSVIAAVQTYIKTYTGLATNAPVLIDYLGPVPVEYAIVPQPGGGTIEAYIDGSSLREFTFALQFVNFTADDAARLENAGFAEAFAAWLESQTNAGTLPTLATGQTPFLMEAAPFGFLYEQGQSNTGVYQIACRLVYEQAA